MKNEEGQQGDSRGSEVKMFLSVITAAIVLAQLIDFLIRRCNVNRIVILQIRSATPIQDMITSAQIYKKVKKLALLPLFVVTMPVPLVSLCSTCQREKV
jgi:hypothetical protein